MSTEPGTFPKRGVPDEDDSGMLSHPTDPHGKIDEAGQEGTREVGKRPGEGECRQGDAGAGEGASRGG